MNLSQDDLVRALRVAGWTSCDKRTVQRYESGTVTKPQFIARRALTEVFQMSLPKLGFPADHEDEDVNRRQLLTLTTAGMLGLSAGEVTDRLRFTLENSGGPDLTLVRQLEAATADLFDAEEKQPAIDLVSQLDQHVDLLTWMVSAARQSDLRHRLTIITGEACALAGWVAYDLNDVPHARKWWAAALQAAKVADDGPLLALTLTYLSYLTASQGDSRKSWGLLDQAANHVRDREHASARAWICARQAEEAASLDDPSAIVSLDRAMTVMDYAEPGTGRPWVRFFDNARLGAMGVATYARLGHPALGPAADAVLATVREDVKTRAVILADIATAQVQRGNRAEGYELAEQALDATESSQSMLGRQRLRSLAPLLDLRSAQGDGLNQRIIALPV